MADRCVKDVNWLLLSPDKAVKCLRGIFLISTWLQTLNVRENTAPASEKQKWAFTMGRTKKMLISCPSKPLKMLDGCSAAAPSFIFVRNCVWYIEWLCWKRPSKEKTFLLRTGLENKPGSRMLQGTAPSAGRTRSLQAIQQPNAVSRAWLDGSGQVQASSDELWSLFAWADSRT